MEWRIYNDEFGDLARKVLLSNIRDGNVWERLTPTQITGIFRALQKGLRDDFFKPIAVYRGLHGSLRKGHTDHDVTLLKMGDMFIETGPVSSWSTNQKTASHFAKGATTWMDSGVLPKGKGGCVIKTTLAPKQIIFNYDLLDFPISEIEDNKTLMYIRDMVRNDFPEGEILAYGPISAKVIETFSNP